MKRFQLLFLLSVGFLLGAKLTMAATIVVGTCKNPKNTLTTIQDGINKASPGDIVQVCPGKYPEQVVISTPLTLEGIVSGNSVRAAVTVPSGGLAGNVSSVLLGISFAAQVLVETGPVNINNITVDGTGGIGVPGLAGIFYESGASGTINQVSVLQQPTGGYGILAENANTTSESVTIENSDLHEVSHGILAGSTQSSPSLTATIKGNEIGGLYTSGELMSLGIQFMQSSGSISSNAIVGPILVGISTINSPNVSILSNTITNTSIAFGKVTGIEIFGVGNIVKSNLITTLSVGASNTGIDLSAATTATVEANKMTNNGVGILFACTTGQTVSGNTITDARIGIDEVPTGLIVPGTIQGVDFIRTGGC
jgi:parallel beta-helix repeat protein